MSRIATPPNPFEDPQVAARYERWYAEEGRRADRLERKVLKRLLTELRGARSLLEVGCGTGHFTRWFRRTGLRAVGLDLSLAMLAEARAGGSSLCVWGEATALPFPDRSFDVVALVTTLEFLAQPERSLEQAFRVARRGVLVGALNRHSLLGRRLRRRAGPIWSHARLFSCTELRRLLRRAAGARTPRLVTRTSLWPLWPSSLLLPWGGFIALLAVLATNEDRGESL